MRLALFCIPFFWATVAVARPMPEPMSQARAAIKHHQPVQALGQLRGMASSPAGRELLKQKRLARQFKGMTQAAFAQARSQVLRERKVELAYLLYDVEHASGKLPRVATPKTQTEALWQIISHTGQIAAALAGGARISPSGFSDAPFAINGLAEKAQPLRAYLRPSQQQQLSQLIRLGAEQEVTISLLRGLQADAAAQR